MDTRNRPTEPWEQQASLSDWLDLLDSVGVDTRKVFANEHELIRKSLQINVHWQRYLEDKPDSLNGAAKKAAADPDDYIAFVDTIVAGALAADPAVHERVRDIVGRAGGIASAAAYRAFRSRGAGLYKALTPRFKKVRDGIAEAGAALPDGVTDLDSAARVGVEAQWLKIEELVKDWDTIVSLLEQWYSAGVFDTGERNLDRYTASMFVFTQYEQAVATYGVEPLRTVRQILTCEPELLTIDEVDELGSTDTSSGTFSRADAWRRMQADKEAREQLLEAAPRRSY
ncbi:hypothetical protein [Curtobacterium sp. VKM Ac-2852]|uniref:hypothetical protein n=1 Tax=Curtobacterium sp. VKM Ac-2852 TaxID=2739024 RepID=UPI0015638BA9|nr:hypothetical protein [Curtobacterium sp. VKM Ac-2852]NQX23316.1 hypothetical protein [Curtobacterium sp. VKM Ac-2852]